MIKEKHVQCLIIGSGASAFNAADCLHQAGLRNLALISEDIYNGTSRNAGSDKQTYYKLSLAGDEGDSPGKMAADLFSGAAVDGDHALIEAAESARCFYKLLAYGVPFPSNRWGEIVGYQTDHDQTRRAVSAGPYTSKMMTECLQREVEAKGIPIFDRFYVFHVLTENNKVRGVLTLDTEDEQKPELCLFKADFVIFATGGEAGIYQDSVYPEGQNGANGILFEAGARGKNLSEWQYGIASVKFRWNLSGSYQQVLPRYISLNPDGTEPREFLEAHYEDKSKLLEHIFLKGYQWPFDAEKKDGSSRIDILVHEERQKGRRVYLDYRENPSSLKDFKSLPALCRHYLEESSALFGTPLDRLRTMNPEAYSLYLTHGIDLRSEALEIAVCAQHNNGGIAVDSNWETAVKNLFVIGEAAGTHGVKRPGGSALNAGQVGGLRAALAVAGRAAEYSAGPISPALGRQIEKQEALLRQLLQNTGTPNVRAHKEALQKRMTRYGGHLRLEEGLKQLLKEAGAQQDKLEDQVLKDPSELKEALQNFERIRAQIVYGEAMLDYIQRGGKSRGSFLLLDGEGRNDFSDCVQEISQEAEGFRISWRKVRPIPERDLWFERVWADYKKRNQRRFSEERRQRE